LATGNAENISRGKALVDLVTQTPESLVGDPVLEAKSLTGMGDVNEGASPSGHSLMARATLLVAALTGENHYREWAWELIQPFVTHALAAPLAFGGVLRVMSLLVEPSREVVVVSDLSSELSDIVSSWSVEGALSVVVTSEQAEACVAAGLSLFEGRTNGSTPTAYVCEGGVCDLPVTTASDLLARLGR
jgi:uncharacterized protein YyaL (SSP411 family)